MSITNEDLTRLITTMLDNANHDPHQGDEGAVLHAIVEGIEGSSVDLYSLIAYIHDRKRAEQGTFG